MVHGAYQSRDARQVRTRYRYRNNDTESTRHLHSSSFSVLRSRLSATLLNRCFQTVEDRYCNISIEWKGTGAGAGAGTGISDK